MIMWGCPADTQLENMRIVRNLWTVPNCTKPCISKQTWAINGHPTSLTKHNKTKCVSLICDTTTCHLYCDDKFFCYLVDVSSGLACRGSGSYQNLAGMNCFVSQKFLLSPFYAQTNKKINSIISEKWLGHAPIPQNTQFSVICSCVHISSYKTFFKILKKPSKV